MCGGERVWLGSAPCPLGDAMLVETEVFAMGRQIRICGFVLLCGTLLAAQDVPPVSPKTQGDAAVNKAMPFVELLRQAEAGDKYAQYSVGGSYATGRGVAKNDEEAVSWWLQAARNGLAEAQNRMGDIYEHGIGVPQNYGEALRWFSRAAKQELAAAQYNLGHMYRYGKGVPIDHARAADLYGQAAAQGLAAARNELGIAYESG